MYYVIEIKIIANKNLSSYIIQSNIYLLNTYILLRNLCNNVFLLCKQREYLTNKIFVYFFNYLMTTFIPFKLLKLNWKINAYFMNKYI